MNNEENNLNLLNRQTVDTVTVNSDDPEHYKRNIEDVNDKISDRSESVLAPKVSEQSLDVTTTKETIINHYNEETDKPSSTANPKDTTSSEDENFHSTLHDRSLDDHSNSLNDAHSPTQDTEKDLEELQIKKRHKRIAIIDSDSEDSLPNEDDNESEGIKDTVESVDVTNTTAELIPETTEETQDAEKKSRLFALCDSESEDEEDKCEHENSDVQESSVIDQKCLQPKKFSAKSSTDKNESKKMTAKEALQQRQEIHSESQRMLRESRLSLPYHRPKSYSIKEFLQNRPRLSLSLSENAAHTPPSLAIKMSTEQLEIVSKKLEEREKQVEKFYKSDSDSEDEHIDTEVTERPKSTAEIAATTDLEENPDMMDRASSEDQNLETQTSAEENCSILENTEPQNQPEISEVLPEQSTTEIPTSPDHATERDNSNLENSEEICFNLDDMEVNCTEENEPPEQQQYTLENEQATIEETPQNPAAPEEDVDENERVVNKLINKYSKPLYSTNQYETINKFQLLKQHLGDSKPRLSGGPNQEIDLETGTTRPSEVTQLMERFMQHTSKKHTARDRITTDVINFTQGEVRKETVVISLDEDEEQMRVIEKPGFRLKKLKDELQLQIAQQKTELWQQKCQSLNGSDHKGEWNDAAEKLKGNDADDEDFLDDEEEEGELTEEDDTEDDYEEEELKERKKPQVKSAFIDDEAEESDVQENSDEDAAENNIPSENEDKENENIPAPTKKPLRRILKGFTEDSDDDDDDDCDYSNSELNKTSTEIENKLNSSTCEDDESILPYQQRPDITPIRDMTESKNDFSFLTPIVQLTGFQGIIGSALKQQDSLASVLSPVNTSMSSSHLKDLSTCQKKLFTDSCDTLNSETNNVEDSTQSSPGKFSALTSTKLISYDDDDDNDDINTQADTQDLMSICSGVFPDTSSVASTSKQSHAASKNADNNTESAITQLNLNLHSEIKNLEEDDLVMQLLDEEEMERFKKKLESQIAANSASNEDDVEEVMGGGRLIDSSDEEVRLETGEKKRHRKLTFSDDDSDSEPDQENEEEIDLHDDDASNYGSEGDNAVDRVIEYDSEENEIELNQEDEPRGKLKASDFFENEAELSESDWDSADEDERGLDTLEIEQGDKDVFDENEIRSDLEKIHMRRVLDQDNREIKILQELLLEDGELHGTGRQRQFRWRNIDDTDANDQSTKQEIETFFDEEESEEQWRKARYHREMFLKTTQEKHLHIEIDDDSNSQVLKLGQEAVRRSLSITNTVIEKSKTTTSPEIKKPLMLLNTRGSFLARNDKFLTRLAELNKVSNDAVGAPKNSKKFVFSTVHNNESVADTSSKNDKKRKTTDGTPKAIKKLRLSAIGTSPLGKDVNSKKQLFE